ncbi:MAG: hypothetical protein J6G98_01595 [Bacilli bacterium]|nr:hypothetical protein [Bacilli bacterium]
MNKKKASLLFNVLIVLFEIIGIIETLKINNKISFEYYTEDSNILALISSTLFVIYLIRNKKIPRWLQIFKYATTICLSITFIVVLFVLGPMYNFNYSFLLFDRALFFQHLVCPILCFITFILFDYIKPLDIVDNFIGLIFTLIYSLILIILNLLEVVTGPYPFLMVKEQSISMSIAWSISLFVLSYMIALSLRVLIKKHYDKIKKIKDKTKEILKRGKESNN